MRFVALASFACLVCLSVLPALATAKPPASASTSCGHIKDLAFVAHQDDDLLFMNPDLHESIAAGGCLRTVYLTASDRGEGDSYMRGRERGVRAAYAYMAGVADQWKEDTVTIGTHHIARFSLIGNPRIELWHLRLKDPWLGPGWGSHTPLSQMESSPGALAEALGIKRDSYTRADMVSTLAMIIREYHPTTIRHLDDSITIPYTALCWRCAGHDHPDHIASARLVRDAMAATPGVYAETGYVDYPTQEREINLTTSEVSVKTDAFRRYAWNDYRYCAGSDSCQEPAGPAAAWVGRTYYVSRPNMPPAAALDDQGKLLVAASGELNDAVNVWQTAPSKWLSLGGRTASPVLAIADAAGHAALLARDSHGRLWIRREIAGLNAASVGWRSLSGLRTARLPAMTAAGNPALLALAYDGLYYWTSRSTSPAGWTPWQPLPLLPDATHDTALLHEPDGGMRAFATNGKGQLYTLTWRGAAAGARWTPVPAPPVGGAIAALRNKAKVLEVYARARETTHLLRMTALDAPATATPAAPRVAAFHAVQPATASKLRWQQPVDLGATVSGRPAIALDQHGDIVVAWLEQSGGKLWLIEAGRTFLAGTAGSAPTLLASGSTLYLIARGNGPIQQYQILVRREGDWRPATATAVLPDIGGSAFAAGQKRSNDRDTRPHSVLAANDRPRAAAP